MITVASTIEANIEKIWQYWTEAKHIVHWNFASDDWHAPFAENDLTVNGKFKTNMAAKDGSFSFDFSGVYTQIITQKAIAYTLDDSRKVQILFVDNGINVTVTESFEPESENTHELQQAGWQAIMDNFKKYVESY